MAATIQFVNKIDASPTVRLDVNDGTTWIVDYEGLDLSPPELRRSVSSSMLTDGENIPASAYGNRVLRLPLEVTGATEDAVATQMQTLHRELNRTTNILKYQINTTSPVFFRTFRSPDYRWIKLDRGGSVYYRCELELVAEPFAYGLKQTLGPYTVNQDPAAGTNPCYVDITGVSGDVETPALVRFTAAANSLEQMVFATRRRGTPSNATWVQQCEGMTMSTDTSVQANNTAYSGSGSNYIKTTFATDSSLVERARVNFPAAANAPADVRGVYRVLLRYTADGAGQQVGTFKGQLKWGPLSANQQGLLAGDKVTFTTATAGNFAFADLGLISFPVGNDPTYDGYSGSELKVRQTNVALYLQRVSGTPSLNCDYLLFTPADPYYEWCSVTWAQDAQKPIVDGPRDETWTYILDGTDDVVQSGDVSIRKGKLPMLSPNQTNRLFAVRKVNTGNTLTDTAAFSVYVWPRYLYTRSPSS